MNVLRGQFLKTMDVALKEGEHEIRIKAIDENIVLDQIMVDSRKDRKFYLIPVR